MCHCRDCSQKTVSQPDILSRNVSQHNTSRCVQLVQLLNEQQFTNLLFREMNFSKAYKGVVVYIQNLFLSLSELFFWICQVFVKMSNRVHAASCIQILRELIVVGARKEQLCLAAAHMPGFDSICGRKNIPLTFWNCKLLVWWAKHVFVINSFLKLAIGLLGKSYTTSTHAIRGVATGGFEVLGWRLKLPKRRRGKLNTAPWLVRDCSCQL